MKAIVVRKSEVERRVSSNLTGGTITFYGAIMIDARDYKTQDELAKAMQLERDISELDYLNKKLAELELSFDFYKHQYELSVKEIKSIKLELQNNIDDYYKKLRINRKQSIAEVQ